VNVVPFARVTVTFRCETAKGPGSDEEALAMLVSIKAETSAAARMKGPARPVFGSAMWAASWDVFGRTSCMWLAFAFAGCWILTLIAHFAVGKTGIDASSFAGGMNPDTFSPMRGPAFARALVRVDR
jgi:hypothetical protein